KAPEELRKIRSPLPLTKHRSGTTAPGAACDRTGLRAATSKSASRPIWRATMSYAVIEAGGKQHRVQPGETLKVEKIEAATGDSITFDQVLLISDGDNVKIGAPFVDGGKVTAEVVSHGRHDKIRII